MPFLGAPFVPVKKNPVNKIVDGMSKTLMMSEIKVVPPNGPGWGGPLSDFSTALGGQTFQGWLPPNSPVPDEIARLVLAPEAYAANKIPRPIPAGHSYAQVITARSHHGGGVNAVHCDGSVQFAGDNTDVHVWRALSSAKGETIDFTAPPAIAN